MLPKKNRLTANDFKRVGGAGPIRMFKGVYCVVKEFVGARVGPRFGVVISKKVDKRASERNRIRRIVYDFFRDNIAKFGGNDYYCILYPSVANKTKEQLLGDIRQML